MLPEVSLSTSSSPYNGVHINTVSLKTYYFVLQKKSIILNSKMKFFTFQCRVYFIND